MKYLQISLPIESQRDRDTKPSHWPVEKMSGSCHEATAICHQPSAARVLGRWASSLNALPGIATVSRPAVGLSFGEPWLRQSTWRTAGQSSQVGCQLASLMAMVVTKLWCNGKSCNFPGIVWICYMMKMEWYSAVDRTTCLTEWLPCANEFGSQCKAARPQTCFLQSSVDRLIIAEPLVWTESGIVWHSNMGWSMDACWCR